ncbi:FkbM family methyltransferase [Nitzschia inconspicua]|uniref:FkbM family methyltransferase n=1 Tax=Nitzschia inconspicua TaxID=303405 RepID=A0A9K3KII1_9STRA|nr:FkbM family methyltransferase [Nitzschia inconspicua]
MQQSSFSQSHAKRWNALPCLGSVLRRKSTKTLTRGIVLLVLFYNQLNNKNVETEEEISSSRTLRHHRSVYLETTSGPKGLLVSSKTVPSFQLWIFLPEEDTISKTIFENGVYEADETTFLQQVVANSSCETTASLRCWAVDIGANVGFHTLHMAALGIHMIAFEPSPDTSILLRQSVQQNGFDRQHSKNDQGRVHVITAAAADKPGKGRLLRHPDSPGMTILQRIEGASPSMSQFPFGVENVVGNDIPLVQPTSVLQDLITTDNDDLLLLKVDAEGYELHALRGIDLDRYPFQYVTFEFFPELLWKAGGTDPLELLLYIQSFGYTCGTKPLTLWEESSNRLMSTTEQVHAWYDQTIIPAYKKSTTFHLNLYCKRK